MFRHFGYLVSRVGCAMILANTMACSNASLNGAALSQLQTGEKLKSSDTAFIFVGDNGHNRENQQLNAGAMRHFCEKDDCQFVSYMGDNFPDGVSNVDDPQFTEGFEKVYSSFHLPFRIVLGNHDYHGNVQAQIDYTARSKIWTLPSRYYSYETLSAKFFVVDTNDLDDKQRHWLADGLTHAGAKWKIVIGHHPVYSSGMHGDSSSLISGLLPILREGKADFYFSGHDHDKELIKSDGIFFVVCGTGSKPRDMEQMTSRTLFASTELGFCHMQMSPTQVSLRMIDSGENIEFSRNFSK